MKEYVFNYKQNGSENAKPHLIRFEGKTEDDAFQKVLAEYPGAVKLAAFEVDDALDKILSVVKNIDPRELSELDAHQDNLAKQNALTQFKANLEEFRRQKTADAVAHNTIERGEMEQQEWNTITSSLTPEEKKALYDEFIADADKNHQDKEAATLEKKFINYIFGIKEKGKWTSDNLTVRDLAKAFGVSHVRVLAIQKAALVKMINNIAKMKRYPFKIKSAEEAIALLLADNIANPEDLHLKVKVNGDMDFKDALNKMVRMERERARKSKEWTKADEKKRRELMKEFKQLEKETNKLRDELGLPRQYEQFFKFFKGQKAGNWQ